MTFENEALQEFLQSVVGSTITVEGRKDAQALQRLGVPSDDIVVLNRGQTMLQTVEALAGDEDVVILSDMDREGKGLRRKLLKMFSMYGIQENPRPRELFARLRLSHVEGL